MLKAGFFAHLGLYVAHDFFDRELRRRLCIEMRESRRTRATIGEGGRDVVEEDARAAAWAQVSKRSIAAVRRKLDALRPRLETHFGMKLGGCQPPQFLVYGRGDFYVAHTDSGHETKSPRYASARRVSVIGFLNGPAKRGDREGYRGGALTFSGLLDDDRLKASVYPLAPEPGLLIAFRSETVHGVTPVTRGERYSVASWYTR